MYNEPSAKRQKLACKHTPPPIRIAVLDIETTGTDVKSDRIVQIAIITFESKNPESKREFSWLVNPGVSIPSNAVEIHGITDDDVGGCVTFGHIIDDILEATKACALAGFNITAFDLPILVAEFSRFGRSFPYTGRYIIDAMTLYRQLNPGTLAGACRRYDVDIDENQLHSAIADVRATSDLLDAMIAKHPDLPNLTELGALSRYGETGIKLDLAGKLTVPIRCVDSLPDRSPVHLVNKAEFTFGKHKGQLIVDHIDYLGWVMKNLNLLYVSDDIENMLRTVCRDGHAH
jgi:DNA polymerase-3 subunit epsilon